MAFRMRLLARLSICLLFIVTLSSMAVAEGSHDRTQFGHDITIGPDEEATDVTCFGCSVRVRGHVTSDVTTFGGGVVVEDQGEIGGDTTTFGGNVRLDRGAEVSGDVTVFGGRVHQDAGATVGGDVTNFGGTIWLILVFAIPLAMLAGLVLLIVWIVRLVTRPTLPAAA
jgi:hypothetical protein